MATNNFKPFGIGAGANVSTQANYEALAALLTGFQSGKASSAAINKALRQGTVMASVLAQFISDSASVDVLDNGNTATILANLKAAMTAITTGRLLGPPQTFTTSGTYTPTPGTKNIVATLVGAGGGGGSNATTVSAGYGATGGGGNAGSVVTVMMPVSGSVNFTVGAFGAGGVVNASSGSAGSRGGDTVFAGVIATGGRGGRIGIAFNGLPTGGPSNPANDANTIPSTVTTVSSNRGSPGIVGIIFNSTNATSGQGGDSEYGFPGYSNAIASPLNNAAGNSAVGYGAGGGGSVSITGSGSTGVSVPGGNGAPGILIIWEYA